MKNLLPEDVKNLFVLLQAGKFTLNAQESVILVNLVNKLDSIIKEIDTPEKKK